MIGIEDLDGRYLRDVAMFYVKLAERAETGGPNKETHRSTTKGMPSQGSG